MANPDEKKSKTLKKTTKRRKPKVTAQKHSDVKKASKKKKTSKINQSQDVQEKRVIKQFSMIDDTSFEEANSTPIKKLKAAELDIKKSKFRDKKQLSVPSKAEFLLLKKYLGKGKSRLTITDVEKLWSILGELRSIKGLELESRGESSVIAKVIAKNTREEKKIRKVISENLEDFEIAERSIYKVPRTL